MNLVYVIVFSLIAAISIYYIFFAKSKNEKEQLQRGNSAREFSIENVGPGGKIAISNFGEENTFLNISVTEKTRHHEDDNFWYELEGKTSQGDDFWLQIEAIDPLVMNAGIEKLDFNTLRLSTSDLEQMRVEKKAFEFNNEQFYFGSKGEARAYSSETQDEDDFRWYRYWNFTNENDTVLISIQQLEDSTPEASISYPIKKNQLRIFELGEDVK